MPRCYMYVVDRDFGFAPNPFHGCCTLATCKPGIRARADLNDWILGMGGARLRATGRCIFAMRVTRTLSLGEYWSDPTYRDKRPVRNGSRKMMVGDNIYHRNSRTGAWQQEDSHHSNPDGTPNPHNVANDTKSDRVLVSTEFLYFGRNAPTVPPKILADLPYANTRNYRVYTVEHAARVINWLRETYRGQVNLVLDAPFDFQGSARRYSVRANKIL